MVMIKNNTITVTRGDTLETQLSIHDDLWDGYVPGEDEKIRFALKDCYSDEEPLIVKTIDVHDMILRLEAADTYALRARKRPYVYDIEVRTPDDYLVATVISDELYVTEEVL